MKRILLAIASSCLLISCDYAKQQKEITELKSDNRELKSKLKRNEIEAILKSENELKDPYRLKAIRIIDSLKLNDPKTLKQIEKQIEISTPEIEY